MVDLEDSPSFTALSYIWGSRSASHADVIICNAYPVEITANCYDVLFSIGFPTHLLGCSEIVANLLAFSTLLQICV